MGLAAVIDTRAEAADPGLSAPFFPGAVVAGASGGKRLRAVTLRLPSGEERIIEADALAMSGGFSPRIHLACHRGGKPRWSEAHSAFLAPEALGPLSLAGSANGAMTLAECLDEGARAASAALADLGIAATPARFGVVEGDLSGAPARRSGASPRRRARPSWTIRTTCIWPISASPCARASPMWNSPSATRPTAWRPIRASSPMSTPSAFWPRRGAFRPPRSAPRPSAPSTRPFPSAH